jgi:hypothetical protein
MIGLPSFEKRHQKVVSRPAFLGRMAGAIALSSGVVLLGLALGMSGYIFFENMDSVDAFANAAMILSGMGPLQPLNTSSGKIFAGCYALFSGLLLVAATAVILAPVFHRVLHRFHVDDEI